MDITHKLNVVLSEEELHSLRHTEAMLEDLNNATSDEELLYYFDEIDEPIGKEDIENAIVVLSIFRRRVTQ